MNWYSKWHKTIAQTWDTVSWDKKMESMSNWKLFSSDWVSYKTHISYIYVSLELVWLQSAKELSYCTVMYIWNWLINWLIDYDNSSKYKNEHYIYEQLKERFPVVYSLGALKHFASWGYFGFEGLETPWTQKISQEKLSKIFYLYQVFIHNCPNVPNIYIIHKSNRNILV